MSEQGRFWFRPITPLVNLLIVRRDDTSREDEWMPLLTIGRFGLVLFRERPDETPPPTERKRERS